MSGFGLRFPLLLAALAVAWGLFVLWPFAAVQRRALGWAEAHVAPRFRRAVTAYTRRRLPYHLGLLVALGLLLAAAAAGPYARGAAETVEAGGRVVLLLDASVSMRATDPRPIDRGLPAAADRFAQAQQIASGLVERLEEHRFAVVGFSGVASYELPMSGDRELVLDTLATSEVHTFYRNSGSSFTAALDAALGFVGEGDAEKRAEDLQVVLLSDGEPPYEEDYESPLAALAERGVAVHAVALGSREGEPRVVYDFRDVVARRAQPRKLAEFVTRRVDTHLEWIAGRTGGSFRVAEGETVEPLAAALRGHAARRRVADPRARRDLSHWPLALFLALFLAEAATFGRRRRRPAAFELAQLGDGGPRAAALALAALVLLGTSCGDGPLDRAHHENELGIAADQAARRDAARVHYQRAIAYAVRSEIPTYNLARSRTLAGDWSEAHDLYQRALALDPGLLPAAYNDGHALFGWGFSERDPRGCQLERTRDLWRAALRRFTEVEERSLPGDPLRDAAVDNRLYVEKVLFETERLIADPPPECAERNPRAEVPQGGPRDGGAGGRRNVAPGAGASGAADRGEGNPDADGQEPEPGDAGGRGTDAPLGAEELEQVRQALERLAEQRGEEGKYFRRSRAEQFPREAWEQPDDTIWW